MGDSPICSTTGSQPAGFGDRHNLIAPTVSKASIGLRHDRRPAGGINFTVIAPFGYQPHGLQEIKRGDPQMADAPKHIGVPVKSGGTAASMVMPPRADDALR